MAQFDMNVFGSNAEKLQESMAGKIFFIDIDHVLENEENPFECTNIDELADLIETVGLISCCNGYKQGEDIILTDGHRRYLAMKKLTEEGRNYRFHGKDITGQVPISIMKQTPSVLKTKMTMIAANAKRDMSNDEKNKIIDQTKETLDEMAKTGDWEWPHGKKAHWISIYTGIKEHYIKDYLAGVNRAAIADPDEDSGSEKEQKERSSKEVSEEEKTYKKSLKQLKKTIDTVHDLQSNAATLRSTLDQSQVDELLDAANNLINELEIYTKLHLVSMN